MAVNAPGALYVKPVYVAGQDFDTRNLKVQKGQPLPERWQVKGLIRWLRQTYGEDAVQVREVAAPPAEEIPRLGPKDPLPEWVTGPRRREKKD